MSSSIQAGRRLLPVVLALAVLAVPEVAQAAKRPMVRTGAAVEITTSTVRLTGAVRPRGTETTYFFQIGPTTLYGSDTTETAVGHGTRAIQVSAPVTGLEPARRYHYRIVGRTAAGRVITGRDRTLRTAPQPLGFTVGATPSLLTLNGSTLISGRLTGTGSAGRQVVLQASPWPYADPFAQVGNALVTDAAGGFSFPILAVALSTQYRVVMAARPQIISAPVTIGVVVGVGTRARPKRVRRGRRVRFSGRITPAVDGQPVAIQRRVDGVWTRIATTVARHDDAQHSRYRRRVKLRHGGRFRVVAEVTNVPYVPAAGRTIRIRVHRR